MCTVHVAYWEEDLPGAYQAKREKLLEFFDWVIEGSRARRLVINGDLVDIPQKGPPAYSASLFGHRGEAPRHRRAGHQARVSGRPDG